MNAHLRGILILLAVTAIWGSTFAVTKILGDQLAPSVLVAWRFTVAALLLAPAVSWIRRRRRRRGTLAPRSPGLWRDGAILGAWLIASYGTQTVALTTTTANRAAFFTALSVVLVPLWLAAAQGRRMPWTLWLALPLAVAGLGLLSWEGGSWVAGDTWALGCAVSYAGFIIALEGMANRHPALPFTLAQVSCVALYAWIWTLLSALTGGLEGTNGLLPGDGYWAPLLYLGVIATALTTLLQTIGQRSVSAAEASLIYALEPVGAAVFSYALIGERIGSRGFMGGALVVASTLLSSFSTGKAHPETPAPDGHLPRTPHEEDEEDEEELSFPF
ncbi:DMT family transporter [Deinococcus sp. Marseille-Q6407]|uniref:DMT family transporter n=1 Tax=Deinococcus sp. Marseille-Q6407 TaxID=2969223 RepID=UPI0021BF053D|nr:DMT family transporter [Deinococcus sp. Marseille-Q6407]